MFIVQIAGRLGKDPETRFTPSGQKVTNFNVAVNQRKGKEDVTIWVRVTVWGERFDKMLTHIKKGSGVIITGRMSPPNVYTDKEGRPQASIEVTAEMIEFNPFFSKEERAGEQSSSNSSYSQSQSNDFSYGSQAHEEPFQGGYSKGHGNGSLSGQASSQNDYGDEKLPF